MKTLLDERIRKMRERAELTDRVLAHRSTKDEQSLDVVGKLKQLSPADKLAIKAGAAFAAIAFAVALAAAWPLEAAVVPAAVAFLVVYAPTGGLALRTWVGAVCAGLLNVGNIVAFFGALALLTRIVPLWAAFVLASLMSMAGLSLEVWLAKKGLLR